MAKTATQPKAGACGCGGGCEDHPEPDPVGRYRCTGCLCFTASPDRFHGWCRLGSTRKWARQFNSI